MNNQIILPGHHEMLKRLDDIGIIADDPDELIIRLLPLAGTSHAPDSLVADLHFAVSGYLLLYPHPNERSITRKLIGDVIEAIVDHEPFRAAAIEELHEFEAQWNGPHENDICNPAFALAV